jgi:hypothetical protein
MQDAGDLSDSPDGEPWGEHHVYAAELRAIADEVAARMRLLEEGYNLTAPEMISWLRDEADRAEAGE